MADGSAEHTIQWNILWYMLEDSADQTLTLISDQYHIAIPSNIYTLVQHELTTNFDCINK